MDQRTITRSPLRVGIAAIWLLALVGFQPRAAHADVSTATGLKVSFAAAGPCQVGQSSLGQDGSSAATVTLTGTGTCAITASQPGDATYAPAQDIVQSFMIARAPTSISLSPISDTPYHDPVNLFATVSPASVGNQTLTGTVVFSIDGTPVGSAPVDSSGVASTSSTITQTVGNHAVTATFSSTNSNFSDSVTAAGTSFSVLSEDTALAYMGDISADYHDSTTLKARLTEDGDATRPLDGATIHFTLGAQSCDGITGSDGIAACSLAIAQDPGSISAISASFSGDSVFSSSSSGNQTFTIKKEETSVRYTGPTLIASGSTPTLSAVLSEDGTTAIPGKSVRISVGTGSSSQSCVGITGSDGMASCTLPYPLRTTGQLPVIASFAGDTDFLPSSDSSKSLIVFAYLARGSFVIGDVTAGSGLNKTVSFWGPQWRLKNSLSGGPAPASFFGFARTLTRTPPTCGTAWHTTPGASSLQPPVNVPSYMAVIVASHITQSGAAISGDTMQLGIVKTQGGSIGSGSVGTGTLVATLCPPVKTATAHVRRHARAQRKPALSPARSTRHRRMGIPTSVIRAGFSFRYASRPAWHPDRHGRALPVTRLARGYDRTTSSRASTGHHLRAQTGTGAQSQQIEFDALPDKTFGDTPFQITATSVTQTAGTGGVPPDPSTVASSIDGTVVTTIGSATSFLYRGDNPIQTGVAPGTIDPVRASVLKGRVLDNRGNPLSGVTVTVLGHPELGQTLSRDDGKFDLAVNGGGKLTVSYSKDGYLPSQRNVDAPWQDYASLPDVVLLPLDPNVTEVDLPGTTPIQVARGSVESDADGSRQATLFFPQGTTATMTLPGGGTQPLSTLHVRATEYTVGANGPAAMPADLPPSSGYTYATEFSVDEAQAAGATGVEFSRPVISYLENFLNFPVGMSVPAGRYDDSTGQWIPEPNGKIIKILSVTNGMADLDVDGSGAPASSAALAALGISDAERGQVASLYAVGTSLWRTPLNHFSPWDMNWPYGPPPDSSPPNQPRPDPNNDPNKPDPCKGKGSIIGCLSQSLGEDVPVTGTPFWLHYESNRSAGEKGAYTLPIALSGPSLPAGVLSIELEIKIAGRLFTQSFSAAPNLTYTFTWDGKDSYGRDVQGAQPATVRIGYTYQAVYQTPAQFDLTFAAYSGVPISGDFARQQITLWQELHTVLGAFRTQSEGLGGWTLNVQHVYDPVTHTLYLGDGEHRSAEALPYHVASVEAGTGQGCSATFTCGDGGPATKASLNTPYQIAVDPGGAIYTADFNGNKIRRVGADGIIGTVAGTGSTCFPSTASCGDGGLATAAQLNNPEGVTTAPDGTVYIADTSDHRVRRVDRNGIITTIAGTGTAGYSGDNGPADGAQLNGPSGLALGPDGSLYIADTGNNVVRRIGPDGMITTVAGDGTTSFGAVGDGGPATQGHLHAPEGVAVGPDGSLYIADSLDLRVRRVGPDGIITTVAGTTSSCEYGSPPVRTCGDGGPAAAAGLGLPWGLAVARDGTIYVGDLENHRVRQITPDGVITTIAGGGSTNISTSPPGPQTFLSGGFGVAAGPDGSVYTDTTSRIAKIAPLFPGLEELHASYVLPSEDGAEVYIFDSSGRNVRTADAVTNAVRYAFGYDAAGRLTSVEDADGNITTIQHDAGGNPTAIIAPGGQTTTLATDANGHLASIADPAGDTYRLTTTADGLLTGFRDPNGNLHTLQYNDAGALIQDSDPAGGSSTLSRTDSPDSSQSYSVTLTTALGRTTTYAIDYLPTGAHRFTVTSPTGATTVTDVGIDGTQTTTYPDGWKTTITSGPDPRWGMLAPLAASLTQVSPSGLTQTTAEKRVTSLADPSDPRSLQSLTDTITVNGQKYTVAYDASTSTWTRTTPGGRTSTATLDAADHVVQVVPDGAVTPITEAYDAHGNLTQVQQGSRTETYTYDSRQRLTGAQDPAGHLVQYDYDAADRVTSYTLPGGEIYHFTYDANGNTTGIAMPSGADHALSSTVLDQFRAYAPPGSAGYNAQYDVDGALTQTGLPGGRRESFGYDAGGRPTSLTYPEAADQFSYSDATDRVTNIQRVAGDTQTLAFTYDGSIPTGVTVGGAASAQYSYTYGSNQLLSAIHLVSGGDDITTSITRDADSLVTQFGPFSIDRQGPGGLITGIHDGTLAMSMSYDGAGRLSSRGQTVNGTSEYSEQLSYNGDGLVSAKTESLGGVTHIYSYTYDPNGQLIGMAQDGATVEQYAYDANGNRTSRTLGANPAEAATYDSQDRLTGQGSTSYAFDVDGFLSQRGSDQFQYSTHGELLSATVGGQTVTYTYDGLGRRIARTDNGGTTHYFYGRPGNPYTVTEVRDPSGALIQLYYDDDGLLYAMQEGASRYYVATDQVGTPRLVSDSNGNAVKALSYDSFGDQTFDSAPSFFLPIGFAGGLSDPVTGLVHFAYRDYDPQTGRWTARDPGLFAGGQGNLFAYVANSPVSFRDPLGLFCIGAAAYDGVGGGGEVCFTKDGFSGCAELGVGVGEEISVKPDGGLASDFFGINNEVSAGINGVIGLQASLSQNFGAPCNGTAAAINLNFGGVNQDVLNGSGKDITQLTQQRPGAAGVKTPGSQKGLSELGSAALEGKATLKGCVQENW